jgi:AraC family transcriptional regulator, activator of mtrCDE
MDELSALLERVTVEGQVTNTASLRSPWGMCGGGTSLAVFHLVIEGCCVLQRDGHPDLDLAAGDAVFLPRGDRHVLADGVGRSADAPALRETGGIVPEVTAGGEGERGNAAASCVGCSNWAALPSSWRHCPR